MSYSSPPYGWQAPSFTADTTGPPESDYYLGSSSSSRFSADHPTSFQPFRTYSYSLGRGGLDPNPQQDASNTGQAGSNPFYPNVQYPRWAPTPSGPPQFWSPPSSYWNTGFERPGAEMIASQPATRYACMYPGCTSRAFKRSADLERHYKQVHPVLDEIETFTCDYPRCARNKEGFRRKDHYRDHLRDYHKEDIGKRDARAPSTEQSEKSQIARKEWWRCRRCLCRVHTASDGSSCPSCDGEQKKQPRGAGSAQTYRAGPRE